LLQRVQVRSTGGAIDCDKKSIAESHTFLYWRTREATEIVIRRCEFVWSAVEEVTLNAWGGQ